MWHGDYLLSQEYEKAKELRRARMRSLALPQHKEALKEVLARSLGSFESNTEHVPALLEEIECDGYIRKRIELSATPGLTFGAYLLIPKQKREKGKLPAVLAIHGHGYGSREIVGLLPDGTPDPNPPGIHQHFALNLVKRGMVVMAPDVVGFGERRLISDTAQNPDAPSSCYTMSTHLLMVGKTLTGLRVAELRKALDYLCALDEVDASRIGTMGFSGGGLLSYVSAALDERIRAAVLTGFPNTFKHSILGVHHCLCNYTPGILNDAELPELIGLIAPRALFLESGTEDPIFPKEGFNIAVEGIRSVYASEGVPDKLDVDLFPGGHEISGRRSYDWLKAVLTPDAISK